MHKVVVDERFSYNAVIAPQDAEEGTNYYSTANIEWPILETVQQGQVLEIKMGMNAYHWVSAPPVH